MMDNPTDYSHLNEAAKALVNAPEAARIHSIRTGTWLGYPRAKDILTRMEELLEYPRITRMPNMLLVAPSFNGKTSILERFLDQHPPDLDPLGETTVCPVVMVESPPTPDVSAFYSRILDALMTPYKPAAAAQDKNSQIKLLFRQLGVKMLIVDEIHHLIAGSLNRQKDFRNALKSLGNETKVVIVAAGNNDDGQCDVRAWADIVAVAAGSRHTLGLKADGSVIATGCNDHGQTDVASWCALRSLESPLSSTD